MRGDVGAAAVRYAELGWRVEERADGAEGDETGHGAGVERDAGARPGSSGLELVTGSGVDALEVPRAAGMLACAWWRHNDGWPDVVRGLPSMPPPDEALAAIGAGPRCYFLVRAGDCPWAASDPVVTRTVERAGQAVIGWHSHGSRVPLPPGRDAGGYEAVWCQLPARRVRLVPPALLLDLLAVATAAVRGGPGLLRLTRDVLAIPVLGDGGPSSPPRP